MYLTALSWSECFKSDEVKRKIASVVMEAIVTDHVFVERYIVMNKY